MNHFYLLCFFPRTAQPKLIEGIMIFNDLSLWLVFSGKPWIFFLPKELFWLPWVKSSLFLISLYSSNTSSQNDNFIPSFLWFSWLMFIYNIFNNKEKNFQSQVMLNESYVVHIWNCKSIAALVLSEPWGSTILKVLIL